MARTHITATFDLVSDQFEHAWYFNRFRCERIGAFVLVTTALASETAGLLAVNGFALSDHDLRVNRERCLKFVADIEGDIGEVPPVTQILNASPARVYPVNYINLARVDEVGEIGLFRYSYHSLLAKTKSGTKTAKGGAEKLTVPCYPVVLFRCNASVQLTLLKEVFSI